MNLPASAPSTIRWSKPANLLGDLWHNPASPNNFGPNSSGPGQFDRQPNFAAALSVPGVRLHLYEKLRPRKGRKMGHLSAVASTPEEAVARVQRAMQLL